MFIWPLILALSLLPHVLLPLPVMAYGHFAVHEISHEGAYFRPSSPYFRVRFPFICSEASPSCSFVVRIFLLHCTVIPINAPGGFFSLIFCHPGIELHTPFHGSTAMSPRRSFPPVPFASFVYGSWPVMLKMLSVRVMKLSKRPSCPDLLLFPSNSWAGSPMFFLKVWSHILNFQCQYEHSVDFL